MHMIDLSSQLSLTCKQLERRREHRRIAEARGVMENVRLTRLQKLSGVVGSWGRLDAQTKQTATRSLQELIHSEKLPPPSPLPVDLIETTDTLELSKPWVPSVLDTEAHSKAYGEFCADEIAEMLSCHEVPADAPSELDDNDPFAIAEGSIQELAERDTAEASAIEELSLGDMTIHSLEGKATIGFAEDEWIVPPPTAHEDKPKPSLQEEWTIAPPIVDKDELEPSQDVHKIMSSLATLYVDYRASTQCLESLTEKASVIPIPTTIDDSPDAASEYMMSKNQQQLTSEEGTFWSQLADPCATDEELQSFSTNLADKSTILSESYTRRTSLPTTQTYEESKEIIQAMGVPCIQPDGPYEAEALAASLVLHGQADYVASEDTVIFPQQYAMHRPLIVHDTGRRCLRRAPHAQPCNAW